LFIYLFRNLLLPVAEEEEAMPEAVEVTGVNSPGRRKLPVDIWSKDVTCIFISASI